MTALTADKVLRYGATVEVHRNKLPVKTATTIWEGAAVGLEVATGYARAFADGDLFAGFAYQRADNAAGASGAISVEVHGQGVADLTVVGTDGWNDYGKTVYATTSGTFSVTDSGSDTAIGKIKGHITGTRCWVSFQAAGVM